MKLKVGQKVKTTYEPNGYNDDGELYEVTIKKIEKESSFAHGIAVTLYYKGCTCCKKDSWTRKVSVGWIEGWDKPKKCKKCNLRI